MKGFVFDKCVDSFYVSGQAYKGLGVENFKNCRVCFFVFVLAVFTFLFFSIGSYAKAVSSDLSDSVFRLHVIANSDSDEDQALKLKVRDGLIDYMNSISANLSSKAEVLQLAKDNIDCFSVIAEDIVRENGFDYPVSVEIGNFDFPTKSYGDVSLPAGFYDALRVKIGEASGHNWWCVMFPPLCFVDVTSGVVPEESKENLRENLSEEDYNLVSDENDFSDFKFKIVEIFNSLSIKVADN